MGSRIGAEVRWDLPALHAIDTLGWEDGTDSFEGGKVFEVGRDEKSGMAATFLRMPPRDIEAAHGGRIHSHNSTSHTLILRGTVSTIFENKTYIMKAGDYFRCPAGVPHLGTIVQTEALMFMLTEGPFGLEFRHEREYEKIGRIGAETRWDRPALHSRRSLRWRKGRGAFEGGRVAMLAENEETGATVMLLRMPPKDLEAAHGGRLHSHKSTSHTLILRGTVSAAFENETYVAKAGTYFRSPAGVAHLGTGVIDPAEMFVINEGSFDVQFA